VIEKAESQMKQTILEAYTAVSGPFTDSKRKMIILHCDVKPTDRELEDNETIETPPIKYYFG